MLQSINALWIGSRFTSRSCRRPSCAVCGSAFQTARAAVVYAVWVWFFLTERNIFTHIQKSARELSILLSGSSRNISSNFFGFKLQSSGRGVGGGGGHSGPGYPLKIFLLHLCWSFEPHSFIFFSIRSELDSLPKTLIFSIYKPYIKKYIIFI